MDEKLSAEYEKLVGELEKPIELYTSLFEEQKYSNAPKDVLEELKSVLTYNGYTAEYFKKMLSVFDGKYEIKNNTIAIDPDIWEYKYLITIIAFFYALLNSSDSKQEIFNTQLIESQLSKLMMGDHVTSKERKEYKTGRDSDLTTAINVFAFDDSDIPEYRIYKASLSGKMQAIFLQRQDLRIIEAVANLYRHNHNGDVSIRELYQEMNGRAIKARPSKEAVKEIVERLRWMMQPIIADVTEEWNAYHPNDKVKKRCREMPMLDINIDYSLYEGENPETWTKNADTHITITIKSEPFLSRQARYTKQMFSIPCKYIDTSGDGGRCTERKDAINRYVLDFIRIQCDKHNNSNKFSVTMHFDTMYKSIDLEVTTTQQAQRDREFIEERLDIFKHGEDFPLAEVLDYEIARDGKSIIGERILIKKKAKRRLKS